MVIRQGDLFWVTLDPLNDSARRPYVVIQNDAANRSRIATVLLCGLTSQLRLANVAGNVLLTPGEGQLPKPSVVNVSQVFTVSKTDLSEYIGSLAPTRIRQILDGLWRLHEP